MYTCIFLIGEKGRRRKEKKLKKEAEEKTRLIFKLAQS